MKIKNLFLFAVLTMGLCACSDEDKGSGDGPAGSAEMLVGVWGASQMTVEVNGQQQHVDVDASISTFTFYADGTLSEYQNGTTVSGTWSYTPSSRKLRLINPVSDLTAYVRSLTSSELIVDMTVPQEGVAMRLIITYLRGDNNQGLRPAAASVVQRPVLSSVIDCINLN